MANWLDRQRRTREKRVESGKPLTDAETDMYKTWWGQTAKVVGVLIAKMTGRPEASTIAKKTGEKYGEHVAKDLNRRIAERDENASSKSGV
jgi:hypothetical protein